MLIFFIVLCIVLSTILAITLYLLSRLSQRSLTLLERFNDQTEYLEEVNSYMVGISKNIAIAEEHIDMLDERGLYRSDDELGIFFQAVQEIKTTLSQYRVYESEEEES